MYIQLIIIKQTQNKVGNKLRNQSRLKRSYYSIWSDYLTTTVNH